MPQTLLPSGVSLAGDGLGTDRGPGRSAATAAAAVGSAPPSSPGGRQCGCTRISSCPSALPENRHKRFRRRTLLGVNRNSLFWTFYKINF